MSRAPRSLGFVLLVGLAACGSRGPGKSGPVVARGDGVSITADEFKARLDEQSPFIRQRYSTVERKKEFLDVLIRNELLARAAQKEGLEKDPEVQLMLRRIMVQRFIQKNFGEGDPAKVVGDADARKFYDEHKDDYVKPKRVRLAQIFFAAPPGSKERPAKAAAARKALARVKSQEKKDALAFGATAAELSEDPASKRLNGDLGYKSRDELEKEYGKPFADAAFALKDGEMALLESSRGVAVVKVTGHQEPLDRSFDQVKGQIQARLYREKRTKDFDEYVKRLRDEAKVTVNEAELEKIPVSAAAGGVGFHGGGPAVFPVAGAGGHPVSPAPPSSPAPAAPQPPAK